MVTASVVFSSSSASCTDFSRDSSCQSPTLLLDVARLLGQLQLEFGDERLKTHTFLRVETRLLLEPLVQLYTTTNNKHWQCVSSVKY